MDFDDVRKNVAECMSFMLPDNTTKVGRAMRYAALDGGKMWRPLTLIATAQTYGVHIKNSVPYAAALELGHAASLILDDLPCMDNEDVRRGKPSCWKEFGQNTAILAHDALVFTAEKTVATGPISPYINCQVLMALNSGALETVCGQEADIALKSDSGVEEIAVMHRRKTGSLYAAATLAGGILGGRSVNTLHSLSNSGLEIGALYQLKDDIYDVEGDPSNGGKPIAQDIGKANFARRVGIDRARRMFAKRLPEVLEQVRQLPSEPLEKLVTEMFK